METVRPKFVQPRTNVIFNDPDCEFYFPNYQKMGKINAKAYDPTKMGAKIKLNRLALAKLYEGFNSIFFDGVKCGLQLEENPIYIIEDVDFCTFKTLLKFIHDGKIVFESVTETVKLINAALKFQMEDLVNICVRWLQSVVDTKNNSDIVDIAVKLFDKATYIKL